MNKLFLMSKFCQPENHNDDADTSSECLQKAFSFVLREICHMSAFFVFFFFFPSLNKYVPDRRRHGRITFLLQLMMRLDGYFAPSRKEKSLVIEAFRTYESVCVCNRLCALSLPPSRRRRR